MPQRLFMDEIVSVGLVPRGDNDEAQVTIWKKAEPSHIRDDKAASGMVEGKTGGTGRNSKDTAVDLPDLSVIEDDDLRDDIDKSFTDLQSQVDDLSEQLAEATAEPEGDDEPDPLEKADPVVKAELDRLRKERDKDRERLESEVAKRRDQEFIGKDYMGLLGDPEEIGPEVRKLADADPDAFEQVETALKAAFQRVDMAELFKEAGTTGGDADPKSRQQAWVEKNRDQYDSEAEAKAAFWKSDEGRAIRKERATEQRS